MRGRSDWEERGVLIPVWGPVDVPYMVVVGVVVVVRRRRGGVVGGV
jgi:hypothetical protein